MSMSVLRFVQDHVRSATYTGVETLESISAEIGMPVSQLVKLNANENSYGPHPSIAAAIAPVPGFACSSGLFACGLLLF